MTAKVDINNVSSLITKVEDSGGRIYILTVGGIGSGKSYVSNKYIFGIEQIDSDEEAKKLSQQIDNVMYNPARGQKGISAAFQKADKFFEKGKSFLMHGTSANSQAALNKLNKAKQHGFTTMLLYVEVPYDQAVGQNRERIGKGERGVPQEKEYKVQRTWENANKTFELLKNNDSVDFTCHFINKRTDDNLRKYIKEVIGAEIKLLGEE